MARAPQQPRRPKSSPTNPAAPPGRPSAYRAEYARQAYRLCLLGYTDKQLGEFFDVSEVTINAWKQKYPQFLKSIKRAKAEADSELAASLFHRAKGYSHKAVKIFAATDTREAQQIEFTEHYPPDVTALIFWLKNRQPQLWRDKQALEHSGPDGAAIQVEEWGAEEIRAELARRGALPGGLTTENTKSTEVKG